MAWWLIIHEGYKTSPSAFLAQNIHVPNLDHLLVFHVRGNFQLNEVSLNYD